MKDTKIIPFKRKRSRSEAKKSYHVDRNPKRNAGTRYVSKKERPNTAEKSDPFVGWDFKNKNGFKKPLVVWTLEMYRFLTIKLCPENPDLGFDRCNLYII